MSETVQSWRMLPGGELTDVLNGLGLVGDAGRARDALAYLAGRDPEGFALAVGYAAPDLLPDRIREPVLDRVNRRTQ